MIYCIRVGFLFIHILAYQGKCNADMLYNFDFEISLCKKALLFLATTIIRTWIDIF